MLKIRVIPILTFNGFALVKTKKFTAPRMVGNPVQAARVFNSRCVDELVFIDIYATRQKRKINLKITRDIINECFMPVGIGGGITSLEDINDLLKIGADKVVIKTQALLNPDLIREAVSFFGSQCISVAVDAKKTSQGYQIANDYGLETGLEEFITRMEDLGVGELITTSVDEDGCMNGFDHELIRIAENCTTVPIVACGGAGNPGHFQELLKQSNIQAVAAGSIFYFTQYTPNDIKQAINEIGKPVRIIT